jgi:drug/metabolite transporter (DMT)-like permease
MLFLVTVVVAWGLTWPVNKVILRTLSPLWAVALRTAIAAVVLVAVAWLGGRLVRPPRADLPVLLSITLLHIVGFSVLSSWGLMLVPAGRSVVLAYTTPLWVIPGAWLFLGERLTRRRAAGVAIGLLGLLTLFNPLALDWGDHEVVLGHLAIVAAAMLWAGSILHIRGHRWRATPFELLPWETMLATGILAVLALTVSGGVPEVRWTPALILLVLYAGIPGSALAYWAVAMASRNLPAVTTSLGLLATPVVSVIASTVFLGEPLTPTLMVAVVLILGGVALGTAEA